MKKLIWIVVAVTAVLFLSSCMKSVTKILPSSEINPFSVGIDTFEVVITDPSRWLEDTKSDTVKKWMTKQNLNTRKFLDDDTTTWKQIYDRLINIRTGEEFGNIGVKGKKDSLYYTTVIRNKDENLYAYYFLDNPYDIEPEEYLNPNKMPNSAVIKGTSFTSNRKLLMYHVSYNGSDRENIIIRDMQTKADLPDTIKNCMYLSTSWYKDKGYYYNYTVDSKLDTIQHALYYHKLGTSQSKDKKIFQVNAVNSIPYASVIGNKYLLVSHWYGRDWCNDVYIKDLRKDSSLQKIISVRDGRFSYIGRKDSIFYFEDSSPDRYPNSRIIAYDISQQKLNAFTEIIPESQYPITGAYLKAGKICLIYMKDVSEEIHMFDLDGGFSYEVKMPVDGTIVSIQGKSFLNKMYISFYSYTYPYCIFEFDTSTRELKLLKQEKVDFDPEKFATEKIFYESYDGTKVPMFICYKKDLVRDGTNPTWLYGYGGFSISYTPYFSGSVIVWLEQGGVYALANIRGGAEYGEKWHEAAKLHKKQNCYDDFQAAAEYLIDQGYTSSEKLAIEGGSNGGLLVATCANQRPNLYGAVVCGAPLIDMLRFQHIGQGMNWTHEYGNPDNSEHFGFIYKYSPLHNIRPLKYPAILITADANDDRTTPVHPYKYTFVMQKNQLGNQPVLLRTEIGTGHANYQKFKSYRERADIFYFLKKVLRF